MVVTGTEIATTVHALLERAAQDGIGIRTDFQGNNEIYAVKMSKRTTVISLTDMNQTGWQAHCVVSLLPDITVTYHGSGRHEWWKDKGTVTSYWKVVGNDRLVKR